MPGRDFRQHNGTEELPADLFADPARSRKNLQTIGELFLDSGSSASVGEFLSAFHGHLLASPDPDRALNNFLRFAESSLSKASLFSDVLHYPLLFEVLMKVFGHSQYFADILVRGPELFRWLTASTVLTTDQSDDYYSGEVGRIARTFSRSERRLDALRRLYRREILRIGVRDILGLANLSMATRELSGLADSLIEGCRVLAVGQLAERYGEHPETPFAVIGLGKLGGGELNYSSDVDIIFVYGTEGEKDGPGGRRISFHEYFNKLAERIVQNLFSSSGEGHLYRVDVRLRPESGSGPLARSQSSYLFYYESRGELWERQMLIKARAVAGNKQFGADFIGQLAPFVYPRTHFQNPAESVARIKARIEAGLSDETNVKLRAGGIRDIEFIVQTLQLLNGGKNTGIREGGTLPAIRKLTAQQLLSEDEENRLTSAYVFLRTLEHMLQMELNTQTHNIPVNPHARVTLARRMGFEDYRGLMRTLEGHLDGVRRIYDGMLSLPRHEGAVSLEAVLEGGSRDEDLKRFLANYGFVDTRKGARNLRSLLTGSAMTETRELDSRTRESLRAVAGTLFAEMGETPSIDMTLNNLTILATAQKFPEQFYGQLKEKAFRKLVVRLCGISPRFARGVARYPAVLEQIASDIKPGETARVPDGAAPEQLVGFRNQGELRVGILHAIGLLTLEKLTEDISDIADVILKTALSNCCRVTRFRTPPLAVFALGKYGTREMMFDADLDLLFICSTRSEDRRGRIETMVQGFVRLLQSVTGVGSLYDVDARLRPEGKSAPLVSDVKAYLRYLHGRASLWERQSLTRLRFICGDEDLGREVMGEVEAFVYGTTLPDKWSDAIVSMRRAMERRSRTTHREFQDIKLGPGGMVDIEFLAQMIQLYEGRERSEIRRKPTTDVLRTSGVLAENESKVLVNSYGFFREIEKLLRITLEEKGTLVPEGEKLVLLARCFEGLTGGALRERVVETMKHTRKLFLSVAEKLSVKS